jgi:pyruvate/2-oxoglutarate dehydrogenase complex dihydrolipoamide acyltransferase (E2) component
MERTLHVFVFERQRMSGILMWSLNEGETFGPGIVIYTYESDKGVTEVEMVRPGILIRKLVPDRTRVMFEQPIAIIDT